VLTVVIDNLPSDCAPVLRTLVRPTGLFQQIVLRISPRLEVLLIGDLLLLLLLLLRLGKDLLLMQLLTNKLFDLCGVRDCRANSPSVATQLRSTTVLLLLRSGSRTFEKSSSDEKPGVVGEPIWRRKELTSLRSTYSPMRYVLAA
jgi:hypothetical protein